MGSKFLSINRKDAIKAVRLFVTAFIASLFGITATGKIPLKEDLISCCVIALTSSCSYLINKYFTNSEDKFMKEDGKQ